MAFCSDCGEQVPEDAASCLKCARPTGVGAGHTLLSVKGDAAMEENVAGLLCYVGGWITGLIFFLIDKRPFVRFHAAQSMVVFGGLHIIYVILAEVFFGSFLVGGLGLFSLGSLLFSAIRLVALVLWIILMVKAYQHQKFKVPIAADISDSLMGK